MHYIGATESNTRFESCYLILCIPSNRTIRTAESTRFLVEHNGIVSISTLESMSHKDKLREQLLVENPQNINLFECRNEMKNEGKSEIEIKAFLQKVMAARKQVHLLVMFVYLHD